MIPSNSIYQLIVAPGLRMGTTSTLKRSSSGMRKRWLPVEPRVLQVLPLPALRNCKQLWSSILSAISDVPI